jgi:hypothetical protein
VLTPLVATEAGEELLHGSHGLLAQACPLVLVFGVSEEERVGARAVLVSVCEPLSEKRERLGDLLMVSDATPGGRGAGSARSVLVVEQREDEVVGVLVLVPVLEREDLQDRVRQYVRNADADARVAAVVEPLTLDFPFDEVVARELSTPDVEGAELRPDGFALRAKMRPKSSWSVSQRNSTITFTPSTSPVHRKPGSLWSKPDFSRLFCSVR